MKRDNHANRIRSPDSADSGSSGMDSTAHPESFDRILEILRELMDEKFSGSIQIIYEEGQVRRVKRSEQVLVRSAIKNRVRVRRFEPTG